MRSPRPTRRRTGCVRRSGWPLDGSSEPRRFTEGPADKSPRWSPDGRWLAYISTTDGRPDDAHVRLAPLDGGMPARLGDLPGPVSQLAWSPDSSRLVVVCRVGAPDISNAGATERNAPRIVRGLAARLDGVGWQDGRRYLFVIDAPDGSARQLTRGEYDHADPSFSPDGAAVVFVSDRHPRRELLMLVNDRGSVTLHRARLGDRRSREVVGGDLIIDGVAARPGRRAVALTAAWPDRPSEVLVTTTAGADPAALTQLNDDFLAAVELAPVSRSTVTRPDGTEVEYFTLLPPGRRAGAAATPRRHPWRPACIVAVRPVARVPPGDGRRRLRRGPAQSARQHELRAGVHERLHR